MGVHISFVRSTDLDKWSVDQILHMLVGGNKVAASHFKKRGWVENSSSNRTQKYTSRAAVLYKQTIQKEKIKQRSTLTAMIMQDSPDPAPVKPLTGGMEGLDDLVSELAGSSKPAAKQASTPAARSTRISSSEKQKQNTPQKKEPTTIEKLKAAQSKPVVRTVIRGGGITKASSLSTRSLRSKPRVTHSSKLLSTKRPTTRNNLSVKSTSPTNGNDSFDAQFAKLQVDAANKRTTPVKETKPVTSSKIEPAVRTSSNTRKESADKNMDRWSGAKSISSDQFFDRNDEDDSGQQNERLRQYSDANSISSDGYFNRGDLNNYNGGDGTVVLDLSEIKNSINNQAGQIGSFASGLYRDIANRYS